MIKKACIFLFSLFLPLLVGYGASKLAPNTAQTYASLILPPLAPPGFVFGSVWTGIYILMGIAFYLITQAQSEKRVQRLAITLYLVQLGVNFFWTYFFFTLEWRFFAFMWLIALLLLVLLCMHFFKSISLWAYRLFFPYLLWLIFAGYLNISIYTLNR